MKLTKLPALTLLLLFPVAAHAQDARRNGAAGERFKQLDKNGDGKVSREELGDPARFAQYDKDGDGLVTFEEARAAYRDARDKPASPAPAAQTPPATAEMEKVLDVRYAEAPGADANLLSLDIYKPKNAKGAPVWIYVHGGGWKAGDKRGVGMKPTDFTARGFIFVSVNYRLVPQVDVLTQLQDTANAVAWVHSHIGEHGGDAKRITLSGHSAGAHHAAIVGTHERFLRAAGKDLEILKGVAVLDTQALDVPRAISGAGRSTYGHAFGLDEKIWREISPVHHVAPGKALPPFFITFSRGVSPAGEGEARKMQAEAFSKALNAAGVKSEVYPATDRSHSEINARFGNPEDNVTRAAFRFFETPGAAPTAPTEKGAR